MALSFKISSGKNEGLVLSPSELRELYFFGIDIRDKNGGTITDQTYTTYIRAAQEEIEKRCNIRIAKQFITETRDFDLNDFRQWAYIRTSFPANKACKLAGKINQQPQIEYPAEWLSVKRDSKGRYNRNVNVVPNQGGNASVSGVVFSGVTPHIGLRGLHNIPNYWEITYSTGFDTVPGDLLNFIGKLAAVNIFHIAGDLILGSGIASTSLGLDGLSQSISTTSSATNAGYGARVLGYLDDIKNSFPNIISYYKGITFTSL